MDTDEGKRINDLRTSLDRCEVHRLQLVETNIELTKARAKGIKRYERLHAKLKMYLKLYGSHLSSCRLVNGGDRCTCGFARALRGEY